MGNIQDTTASEIPPFPEDPFPLENFPDDVLMEIFVRVPAEDIVQNCVLVSKRWQNLADCQGVWKEKCTREGRFIPHLMGASHLDFKKLYFLNPYGSNLIKNPDASEGFRHWKVVDNGGDQLVTEKEPIGSNSLPDMLLCDGCVYKLYDVNYNFSEESSLLNVQVHVKDIFQDSVKIIFKKKIVEICFKTENHNFIKLHSSTTTDTLFSWKISLLREIIPEKCSFDVKDTKLEMKLTKAAKKEWGSVENKNAGSVWVTSFGWCAMEQEVDLLEHGCSSYVLDNVRPDILITEWYATRFDCGGIFRLEVKLLDKDKYELASDEFEDTKPAGRDWFSATVTFANYPPGVRYILYKHSGKDTQFWAGHFGVKFTHASARFDFTHVADVES